MMKVDLHDKVALVTGAARGIGKAIALLFARNGAHVAVNDIDESEGAKTSEEIEAMGRRSVLFAADVAEASEVEKMVEQVINTFGRIDILVNNAGIIVGQEGRVPIHQYRDGDWHRVVTTDLDAVFLCSRAVSRHMVEARSGKIINIGSTAGLVPLRLQSAYVAAKAGVLNLTRSMALELAPYNINVNAIAPGSTLTEATKALFYSDEAEQKERARSLLSHIPLGRPAMPEDIAYAALFLASGEAGYITGSTVVVDGGWTAGGYARDW